MQRLWNYLWVGTPKLHEIAQLFGSSEGDFHWTYEISQGQIGWELLDESIFNFVSFPGEKLQKFKSALTATENKLIGNQLWIIKSPGANSLL